MENAKHLQIVKEYMESFASAMDLDDLNKFLNDAQNFYDDGYFEWMIEQAELLEEKEKEIAKWKGRYTKEKNAHKRYKNDMKYKWRHFRAAENKIDALEYVLAKREKQNQRYRELLESISTTNKVASEIFNKKDGKTLISPDDILQHILRKVNKELGSELE